MHSIQKLKMTILLISLCSVLQFVAATPIKSSPPPQACKLADIQITSYQKQDGSAATAVPSINASACYGAFNGNDDVSQLGFNLGYDNVGWLNQQSTLWSGPGAFISDADLQNLQGLGNIDPGWIFFGKYTAGTFDPSSSNKTGFDSYNYASDLIGLSNCKDKNNAAIACAGGDVVKGEWTYKPPVTTSQQLLDMLGTDKYFDQVTVIFKSSTSYALYNFNIAALGLPAVVGSSDENYMFKGVWDMSTTLLTPNGKNPAGLSHISIWGRDPAFVQPPALDVAAPMSLALSGIGLLLLSLHRRRRQL